MIDMITTNNSSYGEVFNMCSGRSYSVEEVINIIARCLEKELEIVFEPGTPGDIDHMLGNGEKFREKIGFLNADLWSLASKRWLISTI